MTAQHTPIQLSGEGLVSEGEVFAWVHGANPDAYPIADLIVRAINSHALILEALRDALEELETLISADQKDTLRDPITNSTTDERVVRIRAAIRAATGEDA